MFLYFTNRQMKVYAQNIFCDMFMVYHEMTILSLINKKL